MKFLVASAVLLAYAGCSTGKSPDNEVLERQQIVCPGSSQLEYLAWGKSGRMASCKLKHGPFVAAEGGRIVLTGQHHQGNPVGEWKWFDSEGKVERTEIYVLK